MSTHKDNDTALSAPQASPLAALISNPDLLSKLDTEKLGEMYALYEREKKADAERQFNAALVAFQSCCPQIHKDAQGGHGASYARYETIRKTIDPVLAKAGLSVTFGALVAKEGVATMTGTLRHVGGHSHTETIELPMDGRAAMNDTQKGGSAASYCQRYLLRAMCGLVFTDEDDDGEAAGAGPTISEEQVAELEGLLQEIEDFDERARAGFLGWLGVETLGEVPEKQFHAAVSALNKKLARLRDQRKRELEEPEQGELV